MKINYLATSNVPSRTANALQIVKMCEAFSAIGHSVNLILPNLNTLDVTLKSYYHLKHKFFIIKVGKIKKYIKGFNNILIPLKIIFRSLRLKSDLTITRSLVISFILIVLNKKHIFEIHDDLNSSGKFISYIYKKLKLLNSNNIIRLIFISHALKKHIQVEYFYQKDNFKILHDATEINNRNIKIHKNKILKIGYFGSIYESRGVNLILELAKKDAQNIYYIYGGIKKDLEKLKKKKSINLILKSQIPYSLAKKEIIKMDVLLMPYKKKVTFSGDYGNIVKFMSPMKMFDYLGSSKIILSADIPVLRETLISNYNSIFIKNYMNVNSWLLSIKKIPFNQNKFLIIRKNALNTAINNNWNLRAKNMLSN